MQKRKILLSVMLLVYICSIASAIELDPNKFMTVDKLKPGMKGVGKTVFFGTKVEEFQIEILDVMKNAMGPKSDIIWVLCSGGPIEETGVMQGMSGSPIYVDGKLIGAVAYHSGAFSKRPIAGVTPIADMLGIIEKEEKGSLTENRISLEPEIPVPLLNKLNGNTGTKSDLNLPDNISSDISPIMTPVMMAGFSPKTIEYISPILKKHGMIPIQGGGVSVQANAEDAKLEPGSVIGIELVRGDYNAYGSGTITYIDGDKILAFGHSMSGLGPTNFPAAIGKIAMLRPSLQISAKLGSPVKSIGLLTYDSQYGILIDKNKKPEFIPMKVKIKYQGSDQIQEYNFEILKNKLFAPSYILTSALDAILISTKEIGDYTMRLHSEISIKNYPKFIMDNIYSGMTPDTPVSDFASPIYLLMLNRFEEVDIENILLELTFENKRTNAVLDDIRISKSIVKPGDSIDVTLSFTPYMQETIKKEFTIKIPNDMPEGRALLRISDASASDSWERTRAPMKARLISVSQLLKLLQEEEKNNNIIVELFSPKQGMTVRGEELPALPLTAISIIGASNQAGVSAPTLGTTFLKQRIETEYVLSGNANLILIVDPNAQ